MQLTVRNVVWTVFLGVVVVANWNSLAWEAPTQGKREKSIHWEDPKGDGGNRGPGRPGLRMAAKLFEIEMQITCRNFKKEPTVMYVNYLAPVTDLKKPAVWAATPREAAWIIFSNWQESTNCQTKSKRNINHRGPSSDWQEQKLRSVQSQELRPCEAGCATPAAHRRPANTQHSGGKSFEIAPAVFLRRLSMNLAIPLRKPICISDLEPISNPILFVPEKALRFQIHQRVVKIGARLKCCEGRTNLHERSCGAGWDASETRYLDIRPADSTSTNSSRESQMQFCTGFKAPVTPARSRTLLRIFFHTWLRAFSFGLFLAGCEQLTANQSGKGELLAAEKD